MQIETLSCRRVTNIHSYQIPGSTEHQQCLRVGHERRPESPRERAEPVCERSYHGT